MPPDFAKTLKILLDFFSQNGLDYALIGGFALNAYGLSRNTDDIDFLLRRRDASPIISFLESIGYHTLNRTEAFSNHEHPLPGFSRVDFLYVDGETADTMFRETKEFPVLSNFQVRVVKPEHLIALKLFSTSSNPQRAALDRADLDHLLHLKDLNREEVAGYLKKYPGTAGSPETEGPPHD
jgi:hypothetical protein